jgi:hypothetical protein
MLSSIFFHSPSFGLVSQSKMAFLHYEGETGAPHVPFKRLNLLGSVFPKGYIFFYKIVQRTRTGQIFCFDDHFHFKYFFRYDRRRLSRERCPETCSKFHTTNASISIILQIKVTNKNQTFLRLDCRHCRETF